MTHLRPLGGWLLVAGLSLACGRDRGVPETSSTLDSAGVAITTSTAPQWSEGEAWRLGSQPTLQIGGGALDTTLLVGPVAGAFRLPDGRVVVADEGALLLRWFSADGRPLTTAGGRGDGPGEFRDISRVLVVADTVAVVDAQLRRVSLFTYDGVFQRSFTARSPAGTTAPAFPIGRQADGSWVATVGTTHSTGDPAGTRRDSIMIWLTNEEGDAATQVLTIPGNDVVVISTSRFIGVSNPPFGRSTTVRYHDGSLWVATADSYRIDRYDLEGQLHESVRVAVEPALVTSEESAAVRDSALRALEGADASLADAYGAEIRAMPMPATKPPFRTFRLDDAGRLWVQQFALEGDTRPAHWSVFDSEDRLLGTVVLPPLFQPTHIRDAEIIGVWTDPDGVDHVLGYALLTEPLAE